MAQWEITEDHINVGEDDKYNRKGVQGPRGFVDGIPMPFKFKMFDDDGELYYEGVCSEEDHAPLDDFGMPDAGATEIHYLNTESGEYEQL